MRWLAAIGALAAGVAQAQIITPRTGQGAVGGVPPAPVVLRAPLTTSGAPFECGANATSCPRFNGSAISDAPMTWTAQGTPVQVAANVSPFIPGTAGYGPPTDVNYYTGPGNGIDGWHPAGGLFRACIALKPNSIGAQTVPISTGNGAGGNVGFYTTQEPAGTMSLVIAAPGGGSVLTANTVVANGPNFFCFGRDSTNIYVKLNLGTTATTASSAWAAGANPTYLGRLWGATGYAFPGIIYSAVIEPIAWDETWAVDKQRRIAGMTGSFGEPLTCTRSTTASYFANGLLWTAPPNVCRIESTGLRADPSATNLMLRSEALDNAAWTTSGTVTVTADQGVFVDGATSMDKLDNTAGTNIDVRYQSLAVSSSTGPWTGSGWVRSVSGTSDETLRVQCNTAGNASACNCYREDGGACVATISTNTCYAYANVGTTPVRLVATLACASAQTAVILGMEPGRFLSSTGTGIFGGAQLETGSVATSYKPTLGTSVAGSADAPSFVNGYSGFDSAGCVAADVTLPSGSPLSLSRIAFLNNSAAAGLYVQSGTALGIYDGTTALTVTTGNLLGTTTRAIGDWSNATKTVGDGAGGHSASGAYNGTIESISGGLGSALMLGGSGGGVAGTPMNIKNLVWGRGATGVCN